MDFISEYKIQEEIKSDIEWFGDGIIIEPCNKEILCIHSLLHHVYSDITIFEKGLLYRILYRFETNEGMFYKFLLKSEIKLRKMSFITYGVKYIDIEKHFESKEMMTKRFIEKNFKKE
jgi:hypothetical protein